MGQPKLGSVVATLVTEGGSLAAGRPTGLLVPASPQLLAGIQPASRSCCLACATCWSTCRCMPEEGSAGLAIRLARALFARLNPSLRLGREGRGARSCRVGEEVGAAASPSSSGTASRWRKVDSGSDDEALGDPGADSGYKSSEGETTFSRLRRRFMPSSSEGCVVAVGNSDFFSGALAATRRGGCRRRSSSAYHSSKTALRGGAGRATGPRPNLLRVLVVLLRHARAPS